MWRAAAVMAVMHCVGAVQQLLAVSSLECSDCHSAPAAQPGHCWKSRVSQRVPCKQRTCTHGFSCQQQPGQARPAHPGHPRVSTHIQEGSNNYYYHLDTVTSINLCITQLFIPWPHYNSAVLQCVLTKTVNKQNIDSMFVCIHS